MPLVVAAPSWGAAAAAGPSVNQLRDNRFCAHGLLAGGCMYCADPVLEHEMLRAAQAVLDEFGGPW
jgi:hypothetical protein